MGSFTPDKCLYIGLVSLGVFWRSPGRLLGVSWGPPGVFWGFLGGGGAAWGSLGVSWGSPGRPKVLPSRFLGFYEFLKKLVDLDMCFTA